MNEKNPYYQMSVMYDWFVKKNNVHPPKQIFNYKNVDNFHITNIFYMVSYKEESYINFFDRNYPSRNILTVQTTSLNPMISASESKRTFMIYTRNSIKIYKYFNINKNNKLEYQRILKVIFEDAESNEYIINCKTSGSSVGIETNKRFFIYHLSDYVNHNFAIKSYLEYTHKKIKNNWIWNIHYNDIIVVIPDKTEIIKISKKTKWKISRKIKYSPFNPFIGLNIKTLDCFWYSVNKSGKDKEIYYKNISESSTNKIKYLKLSEPLKEFTKYKISCCEFFTAFHKNSQIILYQKFPYKNNDHIWVHLPIVDIIDSHNIKNIKKIKIFDVQSHQNKIYLVFITENYVMLFMI